MGGCPRSWRRPRPAVTTGQSTPFRGAATTLAGSDKYPYLCRYRVSNLFEGQQHDRVARCSTAQAFICTVNSTRDFAAPILRS